MSDSEGSDEEVTGRLKGRYREYQKGEPVILFKADKGTLKEGAKSIDLWMLSNLAECIVEHDGITYPSVEHAFQAQKLHESVRDKFGITGVFGDPANNFEKGWTAYFNAKTPKGNNAAKVLKKTNSVYSKKKTHGVIAKMVNNLSRKPEERRRLGLEPNPHWNFGDAHERLWMQLLRSKYRDPVMRQILLSTGDAYLIEFQRNEKKFEHVAGEDGKKKWRPTQEDNVDFYTAYYDAKEKDCKHCNEPGCNSIGKFLMKIRDELNGKVRNASRSRSHSPTGSDHSGERSGSEHSSKRSRVSGGKKNRKTLKRKKNRK